MDLRQILLHVPDMLLEPAVSGKNGKPASAAVQISNKLALALIETLGQHGFFSRAGTIHSTRKDLPVQCASVPVSKSARPGYELKLYGLDEYWCACFSTTDGTVKEGRDLLRELVKALDGKPAELLSALEGQLG